MARRLDAFLSHQGFGSRQEVKHLLRQGRVRVAGQREIRGARHLADETVMVDGVRIEPLPDTLDLVVHKPAGLACSHALEEAPLIHELFPDAWRHLGLETAGRLDRATTGLLICTTDGGFLHRLINPKHKLPKRYRVTYAGGLVKDAVARCAAGLSLPDEPQPCRPAVLILEEEDAVSGRATLILHEGRYHQVRRMMTVLGGEVTDLHRDRIGTLDLPVDLVPGAWRPLTAEERERLLTGDA